MISWSWSQYFQKISSFCQTNEWWKCLAWKCSFQKHPILKKRLTSCNNCSPCAKGRGWQLNWESPFWNSNQKVKTFRRNRWPHLRNYSNQTLIDGESFCSLGKMTMSTQWEREIFRRDCKVKELCIFHGRQKYRPWGGLKNFLGKKSIIVGVGRWK